MTVNWREQVHLMIVIRRGRQTGRVGWLRGKPGVDYDLSVGMHYSLDEQ